MIFKYKKFLFFVFILFFTGNLSAETLFKVDFADAYGNVETWLKNRGWRIEGDFKNMNARFENNSLVLEPTDDGSVLIGLEFKQDEYLKEVNNIKIIWGVDQYPMGADWSGPKESKRNTREPIAVLIFFGEEKIDSGGTLFPPDAPYFVGLFLGKDEKPGIAYFGNYYQKSGRYYCDSCDGSLGQFATTVNIRNRFEVAFSIQPPPVTKLSIEVDVGNTEKVNRRYSKAYIKSIELLN